VRCATIRYFRVGYFLVLLTPVLSLLALALLPGIIDSLGANEGVTLSAWNLSILVIWTIGITLYLNGYLRRETTVADAKMILLFSILLIPWAVLTYLFASGLYTATVVRVMNPGFSPLTLWDRLEFWTWEFKAIVWIGSGLLLMATSLAKMRSIPQQT
jgi:hypothetical protein